MIYSITKKSVISHRERVCRSLLSQARGLMFRKKQNLVMVFPEEREINLHNCFVFFPIDVLVLDSEMKIVEIKRDFKPFRFWNASQKGMYVVELGVREELRVKGELGSSGDYEVGERVEIT